MSSNAAALPAQVRFFRPDAWANRFPHNEERFSTALCGTHPQPWRGGGYQAERDIEISRVALNLANEA
jgi:hypothetical protein